MESRIRILLLVACLTALGGCSTLKRIWQGNGDTPVAATSSAAEQAADQAAAGQEAADASETPPSVIEPRVERRKIKVPKIDTENFEVGGYYGEISIEDFTAVPLYGVRADYHISEDFFFEGTAGKATAGLTSAETLGGQLRILSDAERQFTYYNLSLGYNFLPGEVFIGRNLALTSGLYLLGGIGSVKFAGDQHFTVNFGAGFRVLPTDWLAIHLDAQDLVFKSDLLGVDRLKNNLQVHLGVTAFF
jgi:outer membrane beta-barrel protein